MPFLLQLLLAFSLFSFLSQIFFEYVKTVRVLLFSTLMLAIMICALGIAYLSLPTSPPPFPYQDVDAQYQTAKQYQYTESEYQALVAKYEYLITVQPTDRDVLLNLALLYRANNNSVASEELTLAAQKLDPNNSLFSN
ncbi:MAG: hypothetical protein QG639_608 [Patescibacteria group bacterium]|jgi:hypothetical protein|nr:hypothetical protein [Patescibacteria group bacterium]